MAKENFLTKAQKKKPGEKLPGFFERSSGNEMALNRLTMQSQRKVPPVKNSTGEKGFEMRGNGGSGCEISAEFAGCLMSAKFHNHFQRYRELEIGDKVTALKQKKATGLDSDDSHQVS